MSCIYKTMFHKNAVEAAFTFTCYNTYSFSIRFTLHLVVAKTFGCNNQAISFCLNVTDVRKPPKIFTSSSKFQSSQIN